MSEKKDIIKKTFQPPVYRLSSVVMAILVFYVVGFAFDAKGLYNWSQKLPVSELARAVGKFAEGHWKRMAEYGLEEPKYTLETVFLDLQEAHPLLYPRKYAEVIRRREDKAKRMSARDEVEKSNPKLKAKRLAEKELIEDDEKLPKGAAPAVLVLGDSIMMSVGPVIKKDVKAKLGGAAIVKAKLATGLARPDVFDWIKELKRLTTRRQYDYVVMMFGTNDSQSFVENGEILTYGTDGWVRAYNRRLEAAMTAACKGARKGIWIGLPPMQSEAFNRKAVRINSWAQRQVATHSCMKYVALDRVIGDESGNFTSYRKIDDHLQKIRMVDGIHVTAQGGTLISTSLMGLMDRGRGLLSH